MNDQLARSLFMEYLYDEIDEKDKQRLEGYLENNPKLQEELDNLQHTRMLLQRMPEEQPTQKLLVMEPRKRTFRQWWSEAKYLLPQTLWGKTGFALAAGFVLLMLVGSIAKLHIASTDTGYSISLGYQPPANEGLSSQQTEALINQIRQENAVMLSEFAESMNRQNDRQIEQVVTYFEQQRMNDLQLIDQNLYQMQQTNGYRWQQANQFLGEVLQSVSLNENN